MSYLSIYKASAGSGKTFTLTREYLLLLFANNESYRHILAVTFTNKACSEMKGRIIEQLHLLSTGTRTAYSDIIAQEYGFSKEKISSDATFILNSILNNYSFFHIKTIDTFFQGIVANFAKELGIYSFQNIELDNSKVLDKAISHLFINIDLYPDLKVWLNDFVLSQINNGEKYDVRRNITTLCVDLFKENVATLISDSSGFFDNKHIIDTIYDNFDKLIVGFEKTQKEIGEKALRMIEASGLSVEDFKNGAKGFINHFNKIVDGKYDVLPSVQEALGLSSKWYSTKCSSRQAVEDLMNSGLLSLLKQSVDHLSQHTEDYATATSIIKYRYTFPVIGKLAIKIIDYCTDNNIRLLSNNNLLLKNLINDNPTPFIYEKTGMFIHHMMLDEFQDTSDIQWCNMKPLVENSLASGNKCLVVGDVKQSIYRWRNGDWTLLGNRIFEDFHNRTETFTLDTNFRSAPEVIDFNNMVFAYSRRKLQDKVNDDVTKANVLLQKAFQNLSGDLYGDVEQKCSNKNTNKGFVQLSFCKSNDIEEYLDQWIPQKIEMLQDSGIEARDIAIIVRKNEECKKVVNTVLRHKQERGQPQYCYDIISAIGLELQNSSAVMIIVSFLKVAINPNDNLSKAFIIQEYAIKYEGKTANDVNNDTISFSQFVEQHGINLDNHLPLHEFCEEIICKLNLDKEGDIPFLKDFMDHTLRFTMEKNGQTASFLQWWDEKGKVFTITQPEAQNAIQVITIHKSKGLQFKAVLIPYCTWSLNKYNQIIWSKSPYLHQPPLGIPYHPVDFNSNLSKSKFKEEYYHENVQQYIDNLNLMYVAFTRAEDVLIINTKLCKSKDTFTSVADFLQHLKPNDNDECQWGTLFQTTRNECTDKPLSKNVSCAFTSYPCSKAIAFVTHAIADISDQNSRYIHQQKGTLLHGLLMNIERASDLERVVRSAVIRGALSALDAQSVRDILSKALSNPLVEKWFDGSGKLLVEKRLLTSGGEVKRPDRVVIHGKCATVIDYKFGESGFIDDHRRQVVQYVDIFKQMGYSTDGYLWYVIDNVVKKV